MNFKELLKNAFSYKPDIDYQFSLPENNQVPKNTTQNQNKIEKKDKIFPSLAVNIEYMRTKYNLLINSDIVLREFTLNARGKQYNAFLVYIDGMVDSKIMDDFILKPLMLRNRNNTFDGAQNKVISEAVANNITVRKIKKFDLPNYLMGCLMPQNSVKEIDTFDDAANGINSRKLCFIYRYFRSCF